MFRLLESSWKKILIILSITLILTGLIEMFCFNFKLIQLDDSQKGIKNIELSEVTVNNFEFRENKLISKNKKQNILFDFDGKYVNKLCVNYISDNEFNTNFDIEEKNVYDKYTTVKSESNHSFKTNTFVHNIGNNAKTLEMKTNATNLTITSIHIDNRIQPNFYRICFLFMFIFTSFCLFSFRKTIFKKEHNAFLLISLISGFMIILFVPNTTFYSYDDETHFKNAYTLLDFGNTSWSDTAKQMTIAMPFSFDSVNSKEDIKNLNNYLNANHRNIVSTSSEGRFIKYTKFAYLPSAICLKLGKLVNLPFSVLFKFGKLGNLLFYSFMMFFSIKTITKGKTFLAFLALIPTNIWLASNYSLDPIIFSSIALGISMFIHELTNKSKILSEKHMILFIVAMIFGILPKAIYAPLILLPVLLPHEKFINKKHEKKFKIGIVMIFIVLMSSFVLPAILSPSQAGDVRVQATSQIGQIKNILSYPIGYINVFLNNAGLQFFSKLFAPETISNFGYLGTTNNLTYYLSFIILIILSVIEFGKKKININCKLRSFFVIICFVIIGLIWTALYLDYTAVGSLEMQGVQGRYFIPLLILLPFIFNITNHINDVPDDVHNINFSLIFISIGFIILNISIYGNILNVLCL